MKGIIKGKQMEEEPYLKESNRVINHRLSYPEAIDILSGVPSWPRPID